MPSEKTAEEISVHIRVPVELRDKIKSRAKTNKRTMNAEMIALLERGMLDEVSAIYELKELGGQITGLALRLEAVTVNREVVSVSSGSVESVKTLPDLELEKVE